MANNTTFFDTTMTFVNDTFGLTLLTKVNNFIMGISPIIEIGFGIFLLLILSKNVLRGRLSLPYVPMQTNMQKWLNSFMS